jgi:SP family sugar porter-like MFS transporter
MAGSSATGAGRQYNLGYVWGVSLVAALGGLMFGYDWVVISGAEPFYNRFFMITSAGAEGWAMGSALVGCLLGAVLSGGLSDKFGRKRLLILSALVFVVSSIGTGLAGSFVSFNVWRMAGGIAIGLASNLSPMYIAEVAPAAVRGRLVAMNQFTIVIGILLAQAVNYGIACHGAAVDPEAWNAAFGWRWMFGVTAVPACFFLVLMFLVPESPRWLVKNGESAGGRAVLARVGGEDYADRELASIEATLVGEIEKVDFRDLLEPRMLAILVLGVALAVLQQWCGMNVIFYYAASLFHEAGYNIADALLNIVGIGTVNLAFTVLAVWSVDRVGRRMLMLLGFAGLAAIHVLIGACFHAGQGGTLVLVLTLAAIGCYALTLAPVTWVVLSEIFPNRIRGAAMSVSVFALWTACFILTFTYPFLRDSLGIARTFWLYAAICVAGFFYTWRRLPETKGKTLEQIERELVD